MTNDVIVPGPVYLARAGYVRVRDKDDICKNVLFFFNA